MAKYFFSALGLFFNLLLGSLLHAEGPLSADQTAAKLKVYGDLEATVFASEPMITNPTNIAIDHRGRVWVCDVVNYRGNQGKRPEGDRILVLEDEDGDGRADKSTVFYQGHDVDSALGICVLGEKVIVSCSPDIFVLTDEDGDGRADKKEILYTKTGDKQHDHTAHAFVFGPDGCLYWNLGNVNKGVHDAEGKVVTDIFGREVLTKGNPYRHGLAFRQNLDGSDLEVLAHNLRNSYELTVDAFGDAWFTDNDDDGNRGTRFCYTFNGGNYGYTDEKTGSGWRSNRIGQSKEVPIMHWHQNDPGSVPNVLNNGSGSPSGVEVYEASMLPQQLRGGIVHCEPGHNVVRVYLPQPQGAGYTAETVELIDGREDRWFRPVDAATAPDGSLLIADWYDPGVGGHHQGDIERGRIYRVAQLSAKYTIDPINLDQPEGACKALCNGNNAVRYAAWTALAEMGTKAEAALTSLSTGGDSRARARAFWLLTRIKPTAKTHLLRAMLDSDERVRAAAVRMTRTLDTETAKKALTQLAADPSPQVRRAVAIALRYHHQEDFAPKLWADLAQQYDGNDRWYLEALGLGAEFNWDACLDAWLEVAGPEFWKTASGRKIVWRSRGSQTFEWLTKLLADPDTPSEELPKLLRALAFNAANNQRELLLKLAESAIGLPEARKRLVAFETLRQLKWEDSVADQVSSLFDRLFGEGPRDGQFSDLAMQFRQSKYYGDLFSLALDNLESPNRSYPLIRFLVQQDYLDAFQQKLEKHDDHRAQLARTLANTGEKVALTLLMPLVSDSQVDIETRRELVRALSANQTFAEQLVELDEAGKLPEEVQSTLRFALLAGPWEKLAERITKLHPVSAEQQAEQLPIAEWMKIRGQAWRGDSVFRGKSTCSTCHKIGDTGKEVGPALTEIGSKLSRTGLYEAILYPSAAISHNYETYVALTDSGTAIKGVLLSETEETVTLRTEKAVVQELRRDELEAFKKQTTSLMPDGLHKLISPQEMADLVAYLQTLKKK